uniref:HAT C-terminal dimerisation domain-containing protein n=1 Tax=Lactuca sativa TaxID=4236 RepID=A0A9R1UKK4_LACSA|nr:hypothetical protein LSAT_V11C900477950 [Lactuca sativa]
MIFKFWKLNLKITLKMCETMNDLISCKTMELAKMMVEERKNIIFPKVYLILKLTLILPITKTSMEHAFSVMKLVNTDMYIKWVVMIILCHILKKKVLGSNRNNTIVKIYQDIRTRRFQLSSEHVVLHSRLATAYS